MDAIDLCHKLHGIEAHLSDIYEENEKISQENLLLRKRLKETIMKSRIMEEKITNSSKKIRNLIKKLKQGIE